MPAGVENAREGAAARFGVTQGKVVTMVDGQIRVEAIIAIAGQNAGLHNGSCSWIDLCPADAVHRAAAWITGNRHGGPTKTVAVFKVQRTPVASIQRAATRLDGGQRYSGGDAGGRV